jgi:hypothetical protein
VPQSSDVRLDQTSLAAVKSNESLLAQPASSSRQRSLAKRAFGSHLDSPEESQRDALMDDYETARHYETVQHTRELRAPSSIEKRTKVTESEPEAPHETWKANLSRTGHEAADVNSPEPDNKDESFDDFPKRGESSPLVDPMPFTVPPTLFRPRLTAQTLALEEAADERKALHRQRKAYEEWSFGRKTSKSQPIWWNRQDLSDVPSPFSVRRLRMGRR